MDILQRITEKKALLDTLRPLSVELEKNLYNWFRVALTYNSNALEGNTLTFGETAQVVEKNLTVSGRTIVEHQEAINHAQAIDWVEKRARLITRRQITVEDILSIHGIVLHKINDAWAGKLREMAVRVSGSAVVRPNYLKVPELINGLVNTITQSNDHTAKIAADAHLQLAFIHPFVDGNGRTARLLLNLILLQDSYPLVFVSAQERQKYIDAIEKALFKQDYDDYYQFIYAAIEASLDEYLVAAKESKR